MSTIIKATKWVVDGKTVVREAYPQYPVHAGAFHKGGLSNYWIHKDGSPASMNSDDILADDWKVWNG